MEESAVRRPRVRDLNAHLICVLCGGYYVDATTIVDCLHSFCRSCIVRHLETSKFCPICDVQVHKAKPLHSIRPDRTLQTLVYKMVPCLYQAEVQRRREFFAKNGVTVVSPEQSGVDDDFFSPDDSISLSLEYYDSDKADDADDTEEPDKANQDTPLRRRYLQCPAAVSMKHLKKFIRMKFGLSSEHRVDIIYAGECLRDDFTLMDVAYTFAWKRNAPMRFSYRIFHPPVYCIPATPTKKVSTSMPERAAAPPQLQPQEEQPPQQQDPLSSSSSSSTKVSGTTPSRTDSSENNGDNSVTPEASSPSPQADNKDDIVNSAVQEESDATREETVTQEGEEEEDNEEEMEEAAAEEVPEDEEPPHKKLCIDERKCDEDSGYEAVETREQDEEEQEVEEEEPAREVTEEQPEMEESTGQEGVEETANTETEYKIVEEPVVEKRVSGHKSKRRRKSSHAKEKERNRVVVEPEEVQQTVEEKETEENEEEEESPVVTQVMEEEAQHEEEEEEEDEEKQEEQHEEQQEEQQEEEEEEQEREFQEQSIIPAAAEMAVPAEEQENEPDFTVRSSTSDEEEEEPAVSTKRSKSAERQRESKEERRRYSKDSEERRRSKSKRDGSTREYGSRKKSKHKSKHHHRGDDASSSKKQRKAHRLLSEVTASTPTILQYQEDVMKLKVKLGPIKPVIENLNAAAAANHQHRHHHHHHHSKHSRKLQEAKESQSSTPEATSPSPTGEIWECSTVPAKTNISNTASTETTSVTTTTSSNTNKTSRTSSPSTSPPLVAGKESSGISAPVSVSSSGTTTTTTATTASTVTTTSVTTVSNTLNNALNSTKERLLQMRAVRHKNITSNKTSDFSSSPESKEEETNNVNSKKSPTSMSEIIMPSSSITVSKVTLGEKRKLGSQKPNNSSGSEIKRPSLEIMLVNAPSTTSNSQSTNSSSSSSCMPSKQCTSSEAAEKKGTVLNDVSVKTNRPPPPTIPLVKIRKSSVSSIRAPAGLTITPKLPSSPSSSSPVSNVPNMSCTTIPKSPISLKLSQVSSAQARPEGGNKQGNSEEQAMRHDDIGALDLSGKSSRCKSSGSASSSPHVFYRSQSSPGTGSKGNSSSPAPSIMTIAQNLVQRQLTNLQHQNSSTESPTSNGNAKSPTGSEGTSNTGTQGVGTPPALTNLKTLSDTAVHIRNMMAAQGGSVKVPQQKPQPGTSPSLNRTPATYNSAAPRNSTSLPVAAHLLQQSPSPRSSTPYHPTLPNSISPLRIPVPPSQLSKGSSPGNGNIPRLRELFPGAVGGRGRGTVGPQNRNQMKPGPNQAVRQIPNPSALLFRQTQNRLQQNAGGMSSPNRLHISPAVNSINKPVYNSPGLSSINNKPNNASPAVSSIRKIENMTRNIEKVAAGLTVRAVEAHVSNK